VAKIPKSELELKWQDLEVGCVVVQPGNASQYKTGDWRSNKPVWDREKCVRCGVCYMFCPDMAVHKTDDGYFEADLYFCKGCGICARECVTGCITMTAEEE
jgi:pyruvate ferredoxin oxidoreductase delta subunit